MSYTNVVFKQHIARNVNRDEIEHQRIDDRSTLTIIQLDFNLAFKLPAPSYTILQNNLLSIFPVKLNRIRAIEVQ